MSILCVLGKFRANFSLNIYMNQIMILNNFFNFLLVKEAHIIGPDINTNLNTYVVLKIGSVKSATSVIKGIRPNWKEDFYL
jgi:hypothetical protein